MSKDIDRIELEKLDDSISQHQAMLTHLEAKLMETLRKIDYRKSEIRRLSLKRTETLNLKLDLAEEPAKPDDNG